MRDYEHQNRLGEYVRQSLLRNGVISIFLRGLETSGGAKFAEIKLFLRDHFPFTQAKDAVWDSYARTFVSWLQELRFVAADESGNVVAALSESIDIASEKLGNLYLHGRGLRSRELPFLPTKEVSVLERVLGRAESGKLVVDKLSRAERYALSDLVKLQAVELEGGGPVRPLVTIDRFREVVTCLMSEQPYMQFWESILSGVAFVSAIRAVFGLHELADATCQTLAEKLVSWGRWAGRLPRNRLPHNGNRTKAAKLGKDTQIEIFTL